MKAVRFVLNVVMQAVVKKQSVACQVAGREELGSLYEVPYGCSEFVRHCIAGLHCNAGEERAARR
jgi:hypothetical protein